MIKKIILQLAFFLSALARGFHFPLPLTICPHTAKEIVKSTTSLLPAADSIGHHILHFNERIINDLLDNDSIPMEAKKPVILNLIKMARQGDNMGGLILEQYEHIVDNLLQ